MIIPVSAEPLLSSSTGNCLKNTHLNAYDFLTQVHHSEYVDHFLQRVFLEYGVWSLLHVRAKVDKFIAALLDYIFHGGEVRCRHVEVFLELAPMDDFIDDGEVVVRLRFHVSSRVKRMILYMLIRKRLFLDIKGLISTKEI